VRILVTGDRNWTGAGVMSTVLLDKLKPGDTLIHGCARGADTMAAKIAEGMVDIFVVGYPALWALYHRGAGPKRNQQMLDSGVDLVLAFHNDLSKSKGTADMVRRARAAGVPVEVFPDEGM
jgi:YspA, cpYpsA-related SLOG family